MAFASRERLHRLGENVTRISGRDWVHGGRQQARVFRQRSGPPDIHRDRREARRHPSRQAEERQPRRYRNPDPRRRACLPDRLGARRTREEISRRPGPLAPHAEPADRLDQRRGLRHRQPEGLHRSRRALPQPGRRQQGGGRRARARDDAVALEAHRRGRPRDPPRNPRPQHLHGPRPARPDRRHRRPRQCRQAPRRAVPRPVPHARARPTTRMCRPR